MPGCSWPGQLCPHLRGSRPSNGSGNSPYFLLWGKEEQGRAPVPLRCFNPIPPPYSVAQLWAMPTLGICWGWHSMEWAHCYLLVLVAS